MCKKNTIAKMTLIRPLFKHKNSTIFGELRLKIHCEQFHTFVSLLKCMGQTVLY